MSKTKWVILSMITLCAGGIAWFMAWNLTAALLAVTGAVFLGFGLPPVDTDTTGSSGASDAN